MEEPLMQFEEFCNSFHELTGRKDKGPTFFQEGQALLSELLKDRQWFLDFLQKFIMDTSFREQQKPSRWLNEYTVYRSPQGSFVILAYIWEPRQIDVIHDHNSWGILGTLSGSLRERKYRRTDDGKRDGYAELEEISNNMMGPGGTTFVMPLDKGIHQLENFEGYSVSINIYGKSVRKGYLNYYDPENSTVTRTYVYSLHKAALAIRTLGYMNCDVSKSILQKALEQSSDDILKKEMDLTLARSESGN